ncbi:MAG: winged helix-turn-helix domain-containing protein [Nitrososphaerales archaeon]|jgi:predicted transcriptional regulator
MDTNANYGTPSSEDPLGQVRRSPMEMVCDILGVVSEGPTKPTHILYRANMSWRVLSSYLDFLLKRGLIEKEDQGGKRCIYTLTVKGRSILQLYDGLRLSLKGTVNIGKDGGVSQILESASIVEPRRTSSLWS